VLVAGVVLVLVLSGGFVALAIVGRDTTGYALFVAGPLVTALTGVLITRRVAQVEAVTDAIAVRTNGQLTADFEGVHEHIEEQTVQLLGGRHAAPVDPPAVLPTQGRPRPAQSPSADHVRGPINPSAVRPRAD
jgi:hypothetical protein